jgi:hypothetical protein
MRLTKVLCIAALVALTAAAANAGSVLDDPKLTINKPGGGFKSQSFGAHPLTTCAPGETCFSMNSVSHPLIINGGNLGMFNYEYIGAATLHTLWVEVNPAPCPDNPNDCYQGGSGSVFADVVPVFTTSGFPFFKFFDGSLTAGEEFVVDVTPITTTTPEPGTVIMFLSLIPAIGFGMKRWNARQTA